MSSCVGRLRAAAIATAEIYDAAQLSSSDALVALDDLEVLARIVDGMRMQTIKRVAESGAHVCTGERDAATYLAHKLHVPVTQIRTTIDLAEQLDELPALSAALRTGQLSTSEVKAIAPAASANPAAENRLLAEAAHGLQRLQQECRSARAQVETPKERRARQERLQSWRAWTDGDFRAVPARGWRPDRSQGRSAAPEAVPGAPGRQEPPATRGLRRESGRLAEPITGEVLGGADLQCDLEGEMRRVAQRLGIAIDEHELPALVHAASFDAMRARADDVVPNSSEAVWRSNEAFFHCGVCGQWQALLDEADRRRYAQRVTQLAPADLLDWAHQGCLEND